MSETAQQEPQALAGPEEREAATLLVEAGQPKETHKVGSKKVILGAHESCNIVLTGEGSSAFHCEILPKDGQWIIKDLGSTNGTFVNGQRVLQKKLDNRDRIQIGKVHLRFTEPQPSKINANVLITGGSVLVVALVGAWLYKTVFTSKLEQTIKPPESYDQLMSSGLDYFKDKDFESAFAKFRQAKKRFGEKFKAAQIMYRLTDFYMKDENQDLSRFGWGELRQILKQLEQNLPNRDKYRKLLGEQQQFLEEEKVVRKIVPVRTGVQDDETKFARYHAIYKAHGSSPVFALVKRDFLTIANRLRTKAKQAGLERINKARGVIDSRQYENFGESRRFFNQAQSDIFRAKTYSMGQDDPDLEEKLRLIARNLKDYRNFSEGQRDFRRARWPLAKEKFGYIGEKSLYYDAAQYNLNRLFVERQVVKIKKSYMEGNGDDALRDLEKFLPSLEGKGNEQAKQEMLDLQRRMRTILVMYKKLVFEDSRNDYTRVIEVADQILALTSKDGGFYEREADSRKRNAVSAIQAKKESFFTAAKRFLEARKYNQALRHYRTAVGFTTTEDERENMKEEMARKVKLIAPAMLADALRNGRLGQFGESDVAACSIIQAFLPPSSKEYVESATLMRKFGRR